MSEMSDSGPSPNKSPQVGTVSSEPKRRWNDLLGRGVFETVIVAVGVFLALMVDQWREDSEREQLADEARAALREELLTNREGVVQRMIVTSNVVAAAQSGPMEVARLVIERRNRPLLTYDAAWTMTIETGAIRWLEPSERKRFAMVYGSHERLREVISNELIRWTELAAFAPGPESQETAQSRNQALRVWQAFAQRSHFALCVNLGRHEQALGAPIPHRPLMKFCVERPATEHPRGIYREWRKRGWTSDTLPQSIALDTIE